MILPIIAGIVLRVALRYAVRAAAQHGGRALSRRALQQVLRQGKRYGDDILKRERARRNACRTCKKLDDLADPCQFLRSGTGGRYAGGSHGGTSGKGAGLESHHIPAQDSYPPGGMGPSRMPAISMDTADHRQTASHGHTGNAGKAYRDAQRAAIQRGGIVAGFAMDVADIKMRFGDKYDKALMEASAYVACISKYPDKYPVGPQRSRRGRR